MAKIQDSIDCNAKKYTISRGDHASGVSGEIEVVNVNDPDKHRTSDSAGLNMNNTPARMVLQHSSSPPAAQVTSSVLSGLMVTW